MSPSISTPNLTLYLSSNFFRSSVKAARSIFERLRFGKTLFPLYCSFLILYYEVNIIYTLNQGQYNIDSNNEKVLTTSEIVEQLKLLIDHKTNGSLI